MIGRFKGLEEKISLHLVEVSPALSDIQAKLLTGEESKAIDFDSKVKQIILLIDNAIPSFFSYLKQQAFSHFFQHYLSLSEVLWVKTQEAQA